MRLGVSEPCDPAQLDIDMRAYYERRGGKGFFGHDYDDPSLAKGFFKVGQLVSITEYSSFVRRQTLRDQLKTSRIQSWGVVQ